EKVRLPMTRTSGRSRVLSGATSVVPLALTGGAAAGDAGATGSATAAFSVDASAFSGPPAPQPARPATAIAAAVAATAVLVAVRLAGSQCGRSALLQHRAAGADGLGRRLPPTAPRAALTLGVEEQLAVCYAAAAEQLPLPQLGLRSGEPGDVGHAVVLRSRVKAMASTYNRFTSCSSAVL